LLCFLDCYSGYHQIALKVSDQDKMTFITPHDIYCYTTMTFGLKNAGVTYEKAIEKCLESQISKNFKAYVDDVVVKTTDEDDLIANLARPSLTSGATAGSSTQRSASSMSHLTSF
jgi:hypothetical protein